MIPATDGPYPRYTPARAARSRRVGARAAKGGGEVSPKPALRGLQPKPPYSQTIAGGLDAARTPDPVGLDGLLHAVDDPRELPLPPRRARAGRAVSAAGVRRKARVRELQWVAHGERGRAGRAACGEVSAEPHPEADLPADRRTLSRAEPRTHLAPEQWGREEGR